MRGSGSRSFGPWSPRRTREVDEDTGAKAREAGARGRRGRTLAHGRPGQCAPDRRWRAGARAGDAAVGVAAAWRPVDQPSREPRTGGPVPPGGCAGRCQGALPPGAVLPEAVHRPGRDRPRGSAGGRVRRSPRISVDTRVRTHRGRRQARVRQGLVQDAAPFRVDPDRRGAGVHRLRRGLPVR